MSNLRTATFTIANNTPRRALAELAVEAAPPQRAAELGLSGDPLKVRRIGLVATPDPADPRPDRHPHQRLSLELAPHRQRSVSVVAEVAPADRERPQVHLGR